MSLRLADATGSTPGGLCGPGGTRIRRALSGFESCRTWGCGGARKRWRACLQFSALPTAELACRRHTVVSAFLYTPLAGRGANMCECFGSHRRANAPSAQGVWQQGHGPKRMLAVIYCACQLCVCARLATRFDMFCQGRLFLCQSFCTLCRKGEELWASAATRQSRLLPPPPAF